MRVYLIRDKATDVILAVAGSYRNAEQEADRFLIYQKIRSYIMVQYV